MGFWSKNIQNVSNFVNLMRIHEFERVSIEMNVSWAVDSTGVSFKKGAFSSEMCGFSLI